MGLSLLAGPANAGKVALLLERYLARLGEEPFLIVPNRSDVDRVERDLLRRSGCLLGGSIGTFDDLFARIAAGDRDGGRSPRDAQRTLIARRAVGLALGTADALARSARFAGFADALLDGARPSSRAGCSIPDDLDGELAAPLRRLPRASSTGSGSGTATCSGAAPASGCGDLGAWHGEPVFAYGFEDLTAAEWSLLEALAGRADVDVSLPYEPGPSGVRLARAERPRTSPRWPAAASRSSRPLGGVRGAGARAPRALALRAGRRRAAADRRRRPLPRGRRGPRHARARRRRARSLSCATARRRGDRARRPVGRALARHRSRPRSRRSASRSRSSRGCGSRDPARARAALAAPLRLARRRPARAVRLSPLAVLGHRPGGRRLRRGPSARPRRRRRPTASRRRPSGSARRRSSRCGSCATPNRRSPAARRAPRLDGAVGLRPRGAAVGRAVPARPARRTRRDAAARRARGLEALGEPLGADELVAALDRLEVTPARRGEPGRVAVLDLLRARTRRFDMVFVLGLEEGSLPRRPRSSPFLDDDRRRELGARLERPDAVSRDRYLFYTACTRATRRL